MWQISHFYEIPLSELWVCEFWLLRCSTMVARAWPVCVEVIQDWLLAAPSQTSPPSCFLWTLLSWDIPLISFNGSLWDVLLRCSKWLLGAWLDSFTMILRCWLVVWVNEPAPLLYDTVIQSYVQLKSGSIERTAHFMGRPTPLKVNGANFSTLLPPRGATFTPFWGMAYRACQPLQIGKFHISVKSTLWATRHQIFFAMLSQWGNFGRSCPQGCNFYPILRCGLTEPASLFKCGKFQLLWIHFWATRRQSFSQC